MIRRISAGLLAATALALSACSSSTAGHAPASTPHASQPSVLNKQDPFAPRPQSGTALARAMDSVSGSGPASSYFEFGDYRSLRALGVVSPAMLTPRSLSTPSSLWGRALLGLGPLGAPANFLPSVVGVNLYAADTAVTIGDSPDVAVRLDGPQDTPQVIGKLTALGAKPRQFAALSGLSLGADNSVVNGGPITTQLQLQNQLDQVVLSNRGFAASPNAATLLRVLGQGPSLLHTGGNSQLAACLGDTVSAALKTSATDADSSGFGVGLVRPAGPDGPLQEVLCVVPRPGKQDTLRAALQQRLSLTATDPHLGVALSRIITQSTVSDVGHLVRAVVTIPASGTLWLLPSALLWNEVPYWDGSCAAPATAQDQC